MFAVNIHGMTEEPKVALVTGAGRRLGRAIALKLSGSGYRVAVHYRSSESEASSLAGKINAAEGSGAAMIFKADLNNISECVRLPHEVIEVFGRLDLLVNNASIFQKSAMEGITPEAIERYHATHVTAPAALSMEASRCLRAASPGRIVNIVDVYADYPKKGYLPYTISKAGLKALTRQLAVELAPDVLVNAVAPGAILEPAGGAREETLKAIEGRIPLGRFGSPEDISRTVLFLAQADYITGQTIVVDGGRSLNI